MCTYTRLLSEILNSNEDIFDRNGVSYTVDSRFGVSKIIFSLMGVDVSKDKSVGSIDALIIWL